MLKEGERRAKEERANGGRTEGEGGEGAKQGERRATVGPEGEGGRRAN